MAYSEEIKKEVIERLERGEKAKKISEQMGISVPTIYNWKKQFNQSNEKVKDKCDQQSKSEIELEKQDIQLEATVIEKSEECEQEIEEQNIHNNYSEFQNRQRSFKEGIRIKQEKGIEKKLQNKIEKEPNYYHEVINYLLEKRKDIYAKAQSRDYEVQREGILQWDKMEGLIEKVNKNRDNKECLIQLHERIVKLKQKEEGMNR